MFRTNSKQLLALTRVQPSIFDRIRHQSAFSIFSSLQGIQSYKCLEAELAFDSTAALGNFPGTNFRFVVFVAVAIVSLLARLLSFDCFTCLYFTFGPLPGRVTPYDHQLRHPHSESSFSVQPCLVSTVCAFQRDDVGKHNRS